MARPTPQDAPQMPRMAYSYLRLSTREQLSGDGKRRQEEVIAPFVLKHGWTLSDESFADIGLSAFDGSNLIGDLGKLLDGIKAGRLAAGSVLVLEDLDRLSRQDVVPATHLFTGIMMSGILIGVVHDDRVYSRESGFGDLILALSRFERSNNESRSKSTRLKGWWDEARENKIHTTPPAWLGKKWLGKRKQLDDWPEIPERVKVVREIFALARQGVSIDRITVHLNKTTPPMGHHGKKDAIGTPGKKQWTAGYVHRLLTNKAVVGEFTPHIGSLKGAKRKQRRALPPIAGYYPAIISQDEFDEVQRLLSARRVQTGPRRKGQITNLFTGLVRDAWDGSPMSVAQKRADSPNKMLVSYAASVGADGSRYMGIRYAEVEELILRSLTELTPAMLTDAPVADALGLMEVRKREIEKQLAEIDESLAKRHSPTLLKLVEKLEPELDQLRAKIDATRASAVGSMADHLQDAQAVIRMVKKAKAENRPELRERLKARLALLIDQIWVYTFTYGPRYKSRWPQKWAYIQIYLHRGTCYEAILMQGEKAIWCNDRPAAIELDLRKLATQVTGKYWAAQEEQMNRGIVARYEAIAAEVDFSQPVVA